MKNLFLIFGLVLIFSSCDVGSDGNNYYSVILPVYEAEVPQEFVLGNTYYIKIKYKRPTVCHEFAGFYFDKHLNERTIAVQNNVSEGSNCLILQDNIVEANLKFYVTNNGSYIFKFWKGINSQGEDEFYEVEVPVVD